MNNCYRTILALQNSLIEIQGHYYIVLAAYNQYLAEKINLLNENNHSYKRIKSKLEQTETLLNNLVDYRITISGNLKRLNGFGIMAKTQNYISDHEDWVEVLGSVSNGKISPVFVELKKETPYLKTLFCKLYTTTDDSSTDKTLLILGTKIEKIMSTIKIVRLMYDLVESSKDNSVELTFLGKTRAPQTKHSSKLYLVK